MGFWKELSEVIWLRIFDLPIILMGLVAGVMVFFYAAAARGREPKYWELLILAVVIAILAEMLQQAVADVSFNLARFVGSFCGAFFWTSISSFLVTFAEDWIVRLRK